MPAPFAKPRTGFDQLRIDSGGHLGKARKRKETEIERGDSLCLTSLSLQ
jgi:hypothetical protein